MKKVIKLILAVTILFSFFTATSVVSAKNAPDFDYSSFKGVWYNKNYTVVYIDGINDRYVDCINIKAVNGNVMSLDIYDSGVDKYIATGDFVVKNNTINLSLDSDDKQMGTIKFYDECIELKIDGSDTIVRFTSDKMAYRVEEDDDGSHTDYDYSSFVGDWGCFTHGHTKGLTNKYWLSIFSADDNYITMSIDGGATKTYPIEDNMVYFDIDQDTLSGMGSLIYNSDFRGARLQFYDNAIQVIFLAVNRSSYEVTPYEYWFTSDNASSKAKTVYSVVLNGTKLEFDQRPVMVSDRIMVPFRKILESMNVNVDYESNDDGSCVISATKYSTVLKIKRTSDNNWTLEKENKNTKRSEIIETDVNPMILNDRTLVPVRVISECFGADVTWNGSANTVYINYVKKYDW